MEPVTITPTAADYAPLVEARDRRIAELGVQVNALVRLVQEKDQEIANLTMQALAIQTEMQTLALGAEAAGCDCNGHGTDHSAAPGCSGCYGLTVHHTCLPGAAGMASPAFLEGTEAADNTIGGPESTAELKAV